ncbi:MAG: FecR domain-containing protein [Ferruginibacter sp.]
MPSKSFEELWNGYINSDLTQDELAHFIQLLQDHNYEAPIKGSIEQLLEQHSSANLVDENKATIIFQNVLNAAEKEQNTQISKVVPLTEKPRVFTMARIAAAASLIGFLFLGAYLMVNRNKANEVAKTVVKPKTFKNDVLPGGAKAILTLADGSAIVLDDAQNGALAQQGNTKVIKFGAKLSYDPAQSGSKDIVYNSISTPRGGQYQVELPDGSNVWLNSGSSLRFPTAFTGKQRRVEVTGEAYFEVAKNAAMPFVVSVGGAEVKVLGTHFNIMAYNDEAMMKTTLLEGSVEFMAGGNSNLLKPGQQSQLTPGGSIKVVSNVDVDQVVAWKNGLFHFENADIGTVMRQLSRWYDVEVVYENKNINDQFVLEMRRNSKLSDVLRVLELTGDIKFDIQGKKIIILK